jgi:hypothetical protein
MIEDNQEGRVFRVFWKGEYPKPKRVFFSGEFDKRRKAVHWCRNHQFGYKGMTILYPDGTEEPYQGEYTKDE